MDSPASQVGAQDGVGPQFDHWEVSTFRERRRDSSCKSMRKGVWRDGYKVRRRNKSTVGAEKANFQELEFESAVLCRVVKDITQKRY